jgi:N-methylhydantoinase A
MHVSTDIGGTFTDFVVLEEGELKTFKLPSTPQNPSDAVKQGLEGLRPDILSHGTTVATNAVLERKGARCALITTKGFKDILTIARQDRPSLNVFNHIRPIPYVPQNLCFEVDERISAQGEILKALDSEDLVKLKKTISDRDIEAVAVSLLFSFLKPDSEIKIKEAFGDFPLSLSSEVLPEFREYERTSTTVLDAYVKPVVSRYISEIEEAFGKEFFIMQSNGGVTTSNVTQHKPVNILLSGPAGGVAATRYLGEILDIPNLISFDMGGTSADISLVLDSQPVWTSEGEIAGVPVRVPMLDITTIGAGGGSIAWLDKGGALRVGPKSAGADPGPICYGKGGEEITVTDCNLFAGYLGKEGLLGGEMPLKKDQAEQKINDLAKKLQLGSDETVLGVQKVVNSNMIRAVRLTLAKRGLDPRDFTLVAFGGAGPMHACAMAKELGITKVLVPFIPGAFSAKEQASGDLKKQGILEKDAIFLSSLDLRYKGQSYEINVDLQEKIQKVFHNKHERLYGYAMPSEPLELVNVRLFSVYFRKTLLPKALATGTNEPKKERMTLFEDGSRRVPVFSRDNLKPGFKIPGPAIVEENTATTVIPPGIEFRIDNFGVIHMEVS